MKKSLLFWIISLICPVVGIVLYFVYKNKDKEISKSTLRGSILGICIYGIVLLYTSTHSTNYFDRPLDEWYSDIKSGETVVTVIGASYCDHCKEYKPVIKKLADKNKINLYFYEFDLMSEKDQDRLTTTFEIGDFKGSVPYTFIMRDGSYVAENTGYSDESQITVFLWENGLIKD